MRSSLDQDETVSKEELRALPACEASIGDQVDLQSINIFCELKRSNEWLFDDNEEKSDHKTVR